MSFGFSSILELQIDGGFYQRLAIDSIEPAPLSDKLDLSDDDTNDVEDVVVATKIRIVSEGAGRPSLGVRLATKLPIASNESGLGLDTMDFYISGLLGKTVRSTRVVGNFGIGILSDPVEGDRQNDVLTDGLSIARALGQGFEVVGEINGRLNTRDERIPPGTETRSGLRVGMRGTHAALRVDGGVMFGSTSRDPSFRLRLGSPTCLEALRCRRDRRLRRERRLETLRALRRLPPYSPSAQAWDRPAQRAHAGTAGRERDKPAEAATAVKVSAS